MKHHKMNHTKMTPGQDPDEFLYIMDSFRDRLSSSTPPEGPTDRQYEKILLQALSPHYQSIPIVYLERRGFGLADIRRFFATIYAENLSRRSITSQASQGPAPLFWFETSVTLSATIAQCSAKVGRIITTTVNSSIRADSTSNNPANDSACAVDGKIRIEMADEVLISQNYHQS